MSLINISKVSEPKKRASTIKISSTRSTQTTQTTFQRNFNLGNNTLTTLSPHLDHSRISFLDNELNIDFVQLEEKATN